MKTVCSKNTCVGCMACMEICPVQAVSVREDIQAYNAVIDEEKCIHCNACFRKCQNNQKPQFFTPLVWKQGWVNNQEMRENSTSGGIASALIEQFLAEGGVVCSCAFKNGVFGFSFAERGEELPAFKGSKYVKSNPLGVYKKIENYLKEKRNVLFIGLPCQVGGLQTFLPAALQQTLTCVDLICHGTPAPKTLELFLSQQQKSLNDLNDVAFRNSHSYNVSAEGLKPLKGETDKYSLGFLSGLFFTENCYACKYAQTNRVGDITLGDSWGSSLEKQEQRKGVSLIACNTERGKELLSRCDLTLLDVDLESALEHNGQLNHPSQKPKNREKFFALIAKGKSFDLAVFLCLPKKCLKQKLKRVAFALGIKK